MEQTIRKVDHSALRVNQAFIIGLLLLAFVLDSVWLVAFVGGVMLLGTAVPGLSLFKRAYQHLLKTADWVIDLGPEGGGGGGQIIATGTPEQIAKAKSSHTGRFLAPVLANPSRKASP